MRHRTAPLDVAIVGGGHNGLVAAAYLARARRRVAVFEARDQVGGAAVTEEIFPGFRYSSAAYLVSLMQSKVVVDLDLARFGYAVTPKEPAYFAPFPDGSHFFMWRDMARTQAEIARFSTRDAEAYPRYEEFLGRVARVVEPTLLRPPPDVPPRGMEDALALGRLGLDLVNLGRADLAMFVRLMTGSVQDFLDRWFVSERLKVALASDGVIGTNGGPRTPGTGYVLLHHQMGGVGGVRGLWGFPRGGMGAVSEAIAASARAAGATIRTGAPVERILIRNGSTRGVLLASGEEIEARVVVSNADPKRTFTRLLDSAELPDDFRAEVEAYRCVGSSFKMNLALDGLPDYRAVPGTAPGPQHRGTTHICPDLATMERGWEDASNGRTSQRPLIEITIPSVYDPSLAPPGKHVMSMFVQYAPYHLVGTTWVEERDRFADRVIDTVAEYAPNLKQIILHRHCLSPLDLETRFGLTGGNIFHGEMSLDQLFSLRPFPGWSRYETPIRGLYLCGSGTHPGGGVMGAPGHNAARAILNAR
ncbi:MAG: NAD(P)/FAD-dependent oxidoreductase [Chloroflexi bacterium]|nr:NAD(P)/FAD-dependent oxidoreductase [Chloroflexota bacterium]